MPLRGGSTTPRSGRRRSQRCAVTGRSLSQAFGLAIGLDYHRSAAEEQGPCPKCEAKEEGETGMTKMRSHTQRSRISHRERMALVTGAIAVVTLAVGWLIYRSMGWPAALSLWVPLGGAALLLIRLLAR